MAGLGLCEVQISRFPDTLGVGKHSTRTNRSSLTFPLLKLSVSLRVWRTGYPNTFLDLTKNPIVLSVAGGQGG